MQRYFNVVQDRQGNAIAGASVRVELAGGVLATIFGVNNPAVPIPNPVQSNTEGEYFFYAPNGSYTLRITAPAYGSEVIPDVALVDAAEMSFAPPVVALTPGAVWVITSGQVLTAPFLPGAVYMVYNASDVSVSLVQGAATTLRMAWQTAVTGDRALAPRGFGTLWAVSATELLCMGTL